MATSRHAVKSVGDSVGGSEPIDGRLFMRMYFPESKADLTGFLKEFPKVTLNRIPYWVTTFSWVASEI